MFNRTLIPLDESELAEAVIPYAEEIARKFGSAITLMRVVEFAVPVVPAEPAVITSVPPQVVAEALEAEVLHAEGYLANLCDRLNKDGVNATYHIARGNPAKEIISYAKEQSVDLIAMSTHGRSGLASLVFGSVANEVLRKAGTPILLIRLQGR